MSDNRIRWSSSVANKNPEELIRKTLRKHPEGVHLVLLAKMTGLSRTTVSKYAFAMERLGEIEIEQIGPSKRIHLRKRT